MGPITIFDKSALQSFNMDESVWFDQFMLGNIVPIFYVETLADLEKEVKKGRSPEAVVGSLAARTPLDGLPNVHHRRIILQELAGDPQPLRGGRILLAGGTQKHSSDGKLSVHFEEFPEAAALNRWRQSDFLAVEREAAKQWRKELIDFDRDSIMAIVRNLLPQDRKISSLSDLKDFIDEFVHTKDHHTLSLMQQVLDIPLPGHVKIMKRWREAGEPYIDDFAPYSAHVFKVDLMYYLGMAKGFIDYTRASNRIDMAYLYYLPFSMVFVSGDNLHHRTAPLFLNDERSYIKAPDLKEALKEINEHYSMMPEEIKDLGVKMMAGYPPSKLNNAVTQLWDKHMREDWRDIAAKQELETRSLPGKPLKSAVSLVKQMESDIPIDEEQIDPDMQPDRVYLTKMVPKQRGSWKILSDEITSKSE